MSPRSVQGLAKAAAVSVMVMATAAASAQQQVYRFGLAMPLTGSQALYGQDQVKAAQWALTEINSAGGINGKKLDMIVLDTQADPQLGIQAVNRLISVEKVPAFITAWSGVVKAVAPIANDNNVVELQRWRELAGNRQARRLCLHHIPPGRRRHQRRRPLRRHHDGQEEGGDRVRQRRHRHGRGRGLQEGIRRCQIVAYEAYDPKATDFTGQLLKVRVANPDIIHLQGLVSDTPQVIAQMRQLGLTQPITSYSAAFNPKLIQQLGAAAEGVIATSLAPAASDSEQVKDYVARWVKEVGREPNGLPYTQYLYDAPYLVADVFKILEAKKLPTTGENFRKEMLTHGTFTLPLTGKTKLGADHTVVSPVYLMEVKGGKWTRKAVVGE